MNYWHKNILPDSSFGIAPYSLLVRKNTEKFPAPFATLSDFAIGGPYTNASTPSCV
jgi:hypothetical protein